MRLQHLIKTLIYVFGESVLLKRDFHSLLKYNNLKLQCGRNFLNLENIALFLRKRIKHKTVNCRLRRKTF